MKRFKNWIHGSLWAVIFGLGLYVLVKGVSIAGGGKKFDKENSTALCTGIYTCTSERYRESKLAFLLTKEVVPLLTYWESKESYFLSEEPQLTVREETDKNPESEKNTGNAKVFRSTEHTGSDAAEGRSRIHGGDRKTVIQKAVKRKRERKTKKHRPKKQKNSRKR